MDLSIWTGYFAVAMLYAGYAWEYGKRQRKPYWEENDENRNLLNR